MRGIWGLDNSHIWAVGAGGTILMGNGTTWQAQASGTTKDLSSVWGSDARNVWAVGAAGTIVKWDGAAWTVQPSGNANDLSGVSGIVGP